ncbi:hypothetical protein Cni_G27369 [Canna indica]|uniref:Uncharacterized protein n=1 Tax=Canna indica TaxID=4628 RepID=A0AAQ3L7Q1_9LILI|nr:hypothetical protein Cni_G27369 [Canna indica]
MEEQNPIFVVLEAISVGLYKAIVRVHSSVMLDNWLFDLPIALKPTFIDCSVIPYSMNVGGLIFGQCWNMASCVATFGLMLAESISRLRLPLLLGDDRTIWKGSSGGRVTAKCVMHFLRSHEPQAPSYFDSWKSMWKLKTTPKTSYK